MPNKLSGREYQQLQQALLSAFPNRSELAQMLLFQLGESLDALAASGNLSETIFSLIQWAVAQGRLGDLIEGAHTFNSGNAELRDFVEKVWQTKAVEPNPPGEPMTKPTHQPNTPPLEEAERKHLLDLLTINQRNLQALERQEALYGELNVPIHILNQLGQVRAEISKLETRLGIPHTPAPSDQPSPTVSADPSPSAPQPRARRRDTYSSYELGVEELLRRLGSQHERYDEALTYQQRLIENVETSRRYGDTETSRAERARIIGQLNSLALDTLGIAFNELK